MNSTALVRPVFYALIGSAVSVGAAGSAMAQDYPNRQIRMIVPTPAGGNNDFAARVIAPKLSESLGQQVIIDNRVGGGSNVGAEMVAKAAPDGYTLLMAHSAMTINMSLYRKLNYDTARDFCSGDDGSQWASHTFDSPFGAGKNG